LLFRHSRAGGKPIVRGILGSRLRGNDEVGNREVNPGPFLCINNRAGNQNYQRELVSHPSIENNSSESKVTVSGDGLRDCVPLALPVSAAANTASGSTGGASCTRQSAGRFRSMRRVQKVKLNDGAFCLIRTFGSEMLKERAGEKPMKVDTAD
jgi:hypothetical protein